MKNYSLAILSVLLRISLYAGPNPPESNLADTASLPNFAPKPAIALNVSLADISRSIESKMVRVEGGSFAMGCHDEKDTSCYYWEKPEHEVKVNTFYMNKYVVTQRDWEAVVGTKPWFSKDCADCPVEAVSWYDAQVFINKLNQLTGIYYRLPTEAEWEYAAHGGTKSRGYKFAGGNNAEMVAWYDLNSKEKSHPVGQKLPNELGLYDMSGNVWQWCSDWFDEKYYSNSPVENPAGPRLEVYRSCRGGSWWSSTKDCRIVNRDRYPADARDDDVGFRIAHD